MPFFPWKAGLLGWPRVHLLEIHDQEWCPQLVRHYVQASLHFVWTALGLYHVVIPELAGAMAECGADSIVDVCAGGGGPLPAVVATLSKVMGKPITGRFSDLFPNVEQWSHLTRDSDALSFEPNPVDATDFPASLSQSNRIRTMFACFHHFQPELAAAMLQDAVDKRQGIFVAELTHRSLFGVCWWFFVCCFSVVSWLFLRPFSWLVALFSITGWLPVVGVFDGVVSCLRTYTVDELRAMAHGLRDSDAFEWRIGERYLPWWPVPATYLVGVPKAPGKRAGAGGSTAEKAPAAAGDAKAGDEVEDKGVSAGGGGGRSNRTRRGGNRR